MLNKDKHLTNIVQ